MDFSVPYCRTWTFSIVIRPYQVIQHGKEFVVLVLRIDDLNNDWRIL